MAADILLVMSQCRLGWGVEPEGHMMCFWMPGMNSLAFGFRLLLIWERRRGGVMSAGE